MDAKYTYCGDYFSVYTPIEVLLCTPETNKWFDIYVTCIPLEKNESCLIRLLYCRDTCPGHFITPVCDSLQSKSQ